MLEQAKARELLAAELEAIEFTREAEAVRTKDFAEFNMFGVALRAITTALKAGRAEERERVVAWLRGQTKMLAFEDAIAAIQRAEHVAEGEGRTG